MNMTNLEEKFYAAGQKMFKMSEVSTIEQFTDVTIEILLFPHFQWSGWSYHILNLIFILHVSKDVEPSPKYSEQEINVIDFEQELQTFRLHQIYLFGKVAYALDLCC